MMTRIRQLTAGWLGCVCVVLVAAALTQAQQPDRQIQIQLKGLEGVAEGVVAAPLTVANLAKASSHWIGVVCQPADELLKKHLKLKGGLVVSHVVPDGPAAKSGIEQHDILLEAGGVKLGELQALVDTVDKNKDKEVSVKLIRAGQPKTLKVTPVKRPEQQALWNQMPRLDAEAIEKWTRGRLPHPGADGQRPFNLRFFHPGVIMPNITAKQVEFPKNLSIIVQKEGDKPARITVKRDDDKWELAEDELGKLPEDVRPHVQRLLGRAAGLNFRIESELAPEKLQFWTPGRTRVLPGQPLLLQPKRPIVPKEDIESRVRRQLDEMQKQLDRMERELKKSRGRQKKEAAQTDA